MAIFKLSEIQQEHIVALVQGLKSDYLAGFSFLSLRKPNLERLKDIDSMVAMTNLLAQPITKDSKVAHLRNRKNAMVGILIYELYKIFNEPPTLFRNHFYTSTVAYKIKQFLGITELSELGEEAEKALTSLENFLTDEKVNSNIQNPWRQDISNEAFATDVKQIKKQINQPKSMVLESNGLVI